ncbi:SusD/RagB family nutrient-binding outer membrane lipoprotein [Paraflavitalea speifideaquila]|uniref:SusD/RagB family nutrient-binding outer membrane lipoprotein n=1 Tax=Paraflavitalea speifideaquila TaxID=3076558 RepID=UPI0028E2EDCC|nr:SusD/RagB family nutrient-binding outer membrane lipoprotein [Paraflavitalea speifideiaquila]
MLADQYGSIVARDFYDGNAQINLLPKMDDGPTVYRYIDSLLADAVTKFDGVNTTPLNFSGGDIMYQGDVNKWKRLAWSLRARYMNHLSKKAASTTAPTSLLLVTMLSMQMAWMPSLPILPEPSKQMKTPGRAGEVLQT